MKELAGFTKRVETWNTKRGRVAKIAVRNQHGQFHGSTNFPDRSKVGQVAKGRR